MRKSGIRRRRRISRDEFYAAMLYVAEQSHMPYESRRAEIASYGFDFDVIHEAILEVFDTEDERRAFALGMLLALRLAP